jgi:hypothetical protein
MIMIIPHTVRRKGIICTAVLLAMLLAYAISMGPAVRFAFRVEGDKSPIYISRVENFYDPLLDFAILIHMDQLLGDYVSFCMSAGRDDSGPAVWIE